MLNNSASTVLVLNRAVSSVEAISRLLKELEESSQSDLLKSLDLNTNRPENPSELVKLSVGTVFKGSILIPGMTENKEGPESPQEYTLEILREEDDELGRKVRNDMLRLSNPYDKMFAGADWKACGIWRRTGVSDRIAT